MSREAPSRKQRSLAERLPTCPSSSAAAEGPDHVKQNRQEHLGEATIWYI